MTICSDRLVGLKHATRDPPILVSELTQANLIVVQTSLQDSMNKVSMNRLRMSRKCRI